MIISVPGAACTRFSRGADIQRCAYGLIDVLGSATRRQTLEGVGLAGFRQGGKVTLARPGFAAGTTSGTASGTRELDDVDTLHARPRRTVPPRESGCRGWSTATFPHRQRSSLRNGEPCDRNEPSLIGKMATLGDPLADLGLHSLVYYPSDPRVSDPCNSAVSAASNQHAASPGKSTSPRHYANITGRDPGPPCLSTWRSGYFQNRSHRRGKSTPRFQQGMTPRNWLRFHR